MSILTCTHVHLKDGNNMVQGNHQGPRSTAQRQGLMLNQKMAFKGQVLIPAQAPLWEPSNVPTHLHSCAPQRWQQHSLKNLPRSVATCTKTLSDAWPRNGSQRLSFSNHGLRTHLRSSTPREVHKVDLLSSLKTMNGSANEHTKAYLPHWILQPNDDLKI